jgi:hypothetical protein
MANVISMAKKMAVISAFVEGCFVRSAVRLTGVSKGAVLRFLESVDAADLSDFACHSGDGS